MMTDTDTNNTDTTDTGANGTDTTGTTDTGATGTGGAVIQRYARAVLDRLPARYDTDAPMFRALWEAAEEVLVPGRDLADGRVAELVALVVSLLGANGGRDGSAVLVLPVVGHLWCATTTPAALDALGEAVRELAGRVGAGELVDADRGPGGDELVGPSWVLRAVLDGATGSELGRCAGVGVAGGGLLWSLQGLGNRARAVDGGQGAGTV